MNPTKGLYVALLGIDGCGKSTVAGGMRERLIAAGREVVDVGATALSAAALTRRGYPWTTLRDLSSQGWHLYLEESSHSAVVTSGLLEFVAHYLIQAELISVAVERGQVAISDSFGLKNVLKTFRAAQAMVDAVSWNTEGLLQGVLQAMGDPFLQPDVGILLDADPELSYAWRMSQRGNLEPGADLSVAGRPGRDSYLELQRALASEYRSKAQLWGWHRLVVDGRPVEETVEAAMEKVLDRPSKSRAN